MHDKPSRITECSGRLFTDISPGFQVGRYHSLSAATVPDDLHVTARSEDGVVMAVEHKSLPVSAVQFHPESILTLAGNVGEKIIRNVVHAYVEERPSMAQLVVNIGR